MSLAAVPAYLLARRVVGPVARAARRRDRGRGAVDGVHGDDHDGEPLLPGRARLRAGRSSGTSSARGRAARRGSSPRSRSRSRPAPSRSRSSPAIATAPLVLASLRRRIDVAAAVPPALRVGRRRARARRRCRRARGQSLADLLGAYSIVGEGGYDVGAGAPLLALARRGARPLRRHRPVRGAPRAPRPRPRRVAADEEHEDAIPT